jgi:hypothetical protein
MEADLYCVCWTIFMSRHARTACRCWQAGQRVFYRSQTCRWRTTVILIKPYPSK